LNFFFSSSLKRGEENKEKKERGEEEKKEREKFEPEKKILLCTTLEKENNEKIFFCFSM